MDALINQRKAIMQSYRCIIMGWKLQKDINHVSKTLAYEIPISV